MNKVNKLEKILKIIVCPVCKEKLEYKNNKLVCAKCNEIFNIKNNVPELISCKNKELLKQTDYEDISFYDSKIERNKIVGFLKKQFRPPSPCKIFSSPKYIEKLKKNITDEQLILDLGSGNRFIHENIITYDIFHGENVSIVGVGEELPFISESFDNIICTSVLEHCRESEKVIQEIVRVLKPSGELYLTVPFFFPYHPATGTSQDFIRMTHIKLKYINESLNCYKIETECGPFSAIANFAQRSLPMLIPFSNNLHVYRMMRVIFAYLFFGLKYLDYFVINHKYINPVTSDFAAYYKKRK